MASKNDPDNRGCMTIQAQSQTGRPSSFTSFPHNRLNNELYRKAYTVTRGEEYIIFKFEMLRNKSTGRSPSEF